MKPTIDKRVQLLANCKFLYGPDTEVITLFSDNHYQAVATTFEPFKASWTTFRHSSAAKCTYEALQSLLDETEVEIANLFSLNGVSLPLSGETIQTRTGHPRVQRASGTNSNARSEDAGFEFIATPESSCPEISYPTPEVGCEVSSKMEEDDIGYSFDTVVTETEKVPEPMVEEPEPDKKMEEDDFGYSLSTGSKKKKKSVVFEEVDEVKLADPIVEEAAEDDGWGGWGQPKPKKKGDTEPEKVPEPGAEEPADDLWSFGTTSKKDKKKGKKAGFSWSEPEAEPVIEEKKPMDDQWLFGISKKGKKKGKKIELEVEPRPESEPEAAIEDEKLAEDPWSFGRSKKDKMKGKKAGFSWPEPEAELIIEAEQPAEDPWSFDSSKKDKKKGKRVTESVLEPEPEPTLGCDSVVCEETIPCPESSVVEDNSYPNPEKVAQESNQDENDKATSYKTLIAEDSSTAEEPLEESPQIIRNHGTQLLAGQTVVLKILHTTKTGKQTSEIMVTLTDNTRTAIFDAVNLHLDSKTQPGQQMSSRKIEIKYGTGKNGDIDISALAESKWPEYLEYFCQYTKFPELTVDVVD